MERKFHRSCSVVFAIHFIRSWWRCAIEARKIAREMESCNQVWHGMRGKIVTGRVEDRW
jgi:hypothetical protein